MIPKKSGKTTPIIIRNLGYNQSIMTTPSVCVYEIVMIPGISDYASLSCPLVTTITNTCKVKAKASVFLNKHGNIWKKSKLRIASDIIEVTKLKMSTCLPKTFLKTFLSSE